MLTGSLATAPAESLAFHMQREAEENGKKNMIVLLPCEIKFFSYHAAFDFAFKLARASLANSWETLDAVRPGGARCCSCVAACCCAPVLRVLVEQNERTTDCRLKAFPMRTLYMVIWQLFDAARAAAVAE